MFNIKRSNDVFEADENISNLNVGCNNAIECGKYTLVGKAFKTNCGHFLCENCIVKPTDNGRATNCPICGNYLKEYDILEILVGVKCCPVSKILYQYTLQSENWLGNLQNLKSLLSTTMEIMLWMNNQLLIEIGDKDKKLNLLRVHFDKREQESVIFIINLPNPCCILI